MFSWCPLCHPHWLQFRFAYLLGLISLNLTVTFNGFKYISLLHLQNHKISHQFQIWKGHPLVGKTCLECSDEKAVKYSLKQKREYINSHINSADEASCSDNNDLTRLSLQAVLTVFFTQPPQPARSALYSLESYTALNNTECWMDKRDLRQAKSSSSSEHSLTHGLHLSIAVFVAGKKVCFCLPLFIFLQPFGHCFASLPSSLCFSFFPPPAQLTINNYSINTGRISCIYLTNCTKSSNRAESSIQKPLGAHTLTEIDNTETTKKPWQDSGL